jgi:hypothetical protein
MLVLIPRHVSKPGRVQGPCKKDQQQEPRSPTVRPGLGRLRERSLSCTRGSCRGVWEPWQSRLAGAPGLSSTPGGAGRPRAGAGRARSRGRGHATPLGNARRGPAGLRRLGWSAAGDQAGSWGARAAAGKPQAGGGPSLGSSHGPGAAGLGTLGELRRTGRRTGSSRLAPV